MTGWKKTAGRISRDDVAAITLTDIREGGPDRVEQILAELGDGRPVVVDTAEDADLQVVVVALLRAEAAGKNFVYRTGPSFVRARSGQQATPAIDVGRLASIVAAAPHADGETRPGSEHGLIAVGSHVGLTTRQLDRLRAKGGIIELELDVPTLLKPDARDQHVRDVANRAADLLRADDSAGDVVIRTSRTLVTGADAVDSLAIARTVSAAPSQHRPGGRRPGQADVRTGQGRHHLLRHLDRGAEHPSRLVAGDDVTRHRVAVGAGLRTCPGHPLHRVRRKRRRRQRPRRRRRNPAERLTCWREAPAFWPRRLPTIRR